MGHIEYMTKTFVKIFLTLWIPAMLIILIVGGLHTLITGDWKTTEKAEK